MHYLDTSVVVALITPEARHDAATGWLDGQLSGDVVVSPWVLTETASALSLKQRAGMLDELARLRAERSVELLLVASLDMVTVPSAAFAQAASMVARWQLGLRSADALHLAIAEHHGAAVVTLDRVQAAAAGQLGVPAVMLTDAGTS